MNKEISITQTADFIEDGMTLMVGGFLAVGAPERIIDQIIEKGTKNLHLIANDTGTPEKGCGRLVANHQVTHLSASHIGTNPVTIQKMNDGEMKVELVPQGSLAERIRAGGAGLGGVLTPTGVGTVVEEGKRQVEIGEQRYIIETALKADVAIIKAHKADRMGNLIYNKSARNQNPLMATAAKVVIAQVEEIVEVGELDPERIITPGVYIDYIVKA